MTGYRAPGSPAWRRARLGFTPAEKRWASSTRTGLLWVATVQGRDQDRWRGSGVHRGGAAVYAADDGIAEAAWWAATPGWREAITAVVSANPAHADPAPWFNRAQGPGWTATRCRSRVTWPRAPAPSTGKSEERSSASVRRPLRIACECIGRYSDQNHAQALRSSRTNQSSLGPGRLDPTNRSRASGTATRASDRSASARRPAHRSRPTREGQVNAPSAARAGRPRSRAPDPPQPPTSPGSWHVRHGRGRHRSAAAVRCTGRPGRRTSASRRVAV